MIILVTGSRDWGDYSSVLEALARYEGQPDVTVRHGDCPGDDSADQLADFAADILKFEKDPMPADWDKYGKAGGYIRNTEMVKKLPKPDICFAFGRKCNKYGGKCTVVPGPHVSHGTRHCAGEAKRFGIEVVRFKLGFDG